MPKLDKRLTDSTARTVSGPQTEKEQAAGYVIHWCRDTPGFGIRVSHTGDRAYISERRNSNGKTRRVTLGKAVGGKAAGAISADMARKLQITYSSELQSGVDRADVKREQRKVEKQDAVTLATALTAYVKGKRRGKDGLPLKDRTKADYLAMVKRGATRADGMPFKDGALYLLAGKSINRITADDIRTVYKTAEVSSTRQATYALQVLRAVLNWHGITVPESPLARTTAGRDRIVLATTVGSPKPIPPELLGAWWRAASKMASNEAASGCRFILLTGSRPGEVFGSEHEPGMLVENVDLSGQRVTHLNTKNRKDHVIALSKQAFEIVKAHCKDKKPGQKVFGVLDPGKTLENINSAASVDGITPHKLRHTFASVAEELVSSYALKRMLNHTDASDVTGGHYVGKSETQMRTAWQIVADFICSAT